MRKFNTNFTFYKRITDDAQMGKRCQQVIAFSFIFSLLFTFNPGVLSVNGVTADNGTVYLEAINRNSGKDCLAEKGPQLTAPPDKYLAATDNSTDRNGLIKLAWNRLCSATSYELQISKDAGFTRLITWALNSEPVKLDSGTILLDLDPNDAVNPSVYVRDGALPESDAVYWWRVRAIESIDGQIERSPWSDTRRFMVKSGGFIVGPQDREDRCFYPYLLYPKHSATGLNVG